MNLKNAFLALAITIFTMTSGTAFGTASDESSEPFDQGRPTAAQTPAPSIHNEIMTNLQPTPHNHLGTERTNRMAEMFGQDEEDNVADIIRFRWCFRKCANVTEVLGNGLLYIGSGLSSIAAAINLVGSPQVSNYLLFAGTACFAGHITLIGLAKCSAREAGERESQLKDLAADLGFRVVSLQPTVTDDQAETGGSSASQSRPALTGSNAV
jgi:hypothetical protein